MKSLITQETAVRRLRVAHTGVYSCALFPLNTDFFRMQPWHYRAHYTPSNGCFVHWWWHLYLLCGIFEGTETLVRLQKLDGAWPCKMTLAWLVPVDLTSVSSYPFTRAKMTNINGPQHTFVKWIILKLKFKLSLIFISQVFALCYLTSEFAK